MLFCHTGWRVIQGSRRSFYSARWTYNAIASILWTVAIQVLITGAGVITGLLFDCVFVY